MELTVKKIGNSLGVILPKKMIDQLNVDKGDSLFVQESESGYQLSPYDPSLAEELDLARQIMKDRRTALRELSK